MELTKKTATELAALLKSREISAVEVATAHLDRIKSTDPVIEAFLHVDEAKTMEQAKAVDAAFAAGDALGPLAGIPVGYKDNICTKGVPTTCASRMLENFVPPYSATVVEKIEKAGAVFGGKLNMDEFAMGSSCESSYFKTTKNPWDTARVPGGSSGGTAAAVAACQLPLALGSDTGGSIRQPSAFCGVVGLKPTYGAVSRYGVVAFASSLDQVGPVARTVEDAALLFSVISGKDAQRDATSKDYTFDAALKSDMKGLRIGVPKEFYGEGISKEVCETVKKALTEVEKAGAKLVELSLPSTAHALPAYYIISSAEASSNMSRFDGVKYGYSGDRSGSLEELYLSSRSEGFGDEVKRRIMLGTYVLSAGYYDAHYKRAKLMQQRIIAEFKAAYEQCDLIITPTTPFTAFKIGERINDPLQMYTIDLCTVPVNIAGLPAINLPCGCDAGGLPVGMQLIGPHFSENLILSAAKWYEGVRGNITVKETVV